MRVPGPVLAVAGGHVAILLLVAGRYGYHRDELYFLEAGQHLAWGYVDQPPLVPLLARAQVALLGSFVAAIRVIPALVSGGVVVLAALLARELGGDRRAQIVAAGAVAGAGFVLGVGHLLSTATFDFAFWMALLVVSARMMRTGEPRWWLVFGGVAGLALWNKQLVVLLAVALVGGLVIERRWDLLAPRWLAAGGALALVIAAPTIVWQAANGWPQLEMARALSERLGGENRALLLPLQLLMLGPLLLPLGLAGARALWGRQGGPLRVFRPLLWAYGVALAVTFVTAGRPYYPLPLAAAIVIAGAAALGGRDASRRRLTALVAANAIFAVFVALPVLPPAVLGDTPFGQINDTLVETVGWPEMVATVAAVVAGLPEGEREQVVLLTGPYGEAGALDRYGPQAGLPQPYSGHNSYWHWRRPGNDAATVVAVRMSGELLDDHFASCRRAPSIDNGLGVDNEAQGQPVWVCRGLLGSWRERWPDFRHYN
ncbi:MAG: ArnT family glycosyltransferase [Egibacteraceae bacterium]